MRKSLWPIWAILFLLFVPVCRLLTPTASAAECGRPDGYGVVSIEVLHLNTETGWTLIEGQEISMSYGPGLKRTQTATSGSNGIAYFFLDQAQFAGHPGYRIGHVSDGRREDATEWEVSDIVFDEPITAVTDCHDVSATVYLTEVNEDVDTETATKPTANSESNRAVYTSREECTVNINPYMDVNENGLFDLEDEYLAEDQNLVVSVEFNNGGRVQYNYMHRDARLPEFGYEPWESLDGIEVSPIENQVQYLMLNHTETGPAWIPTDFNNTGVLLGDCGEIEIVSLFTPNSFPTEDGSGCNCDDLEYQLDELQGRVDALDGAMSALFLMLDGGSPTEFGFRFEFDGLQQQQPVSPQQQSNDLSWLWVVLLQVICLGLLALFGLLLFLAGLIGWLIGRAHQHEPPAPRTTMGFSTPSTTPRN